MSHKVSESSQRVLELVKAIEPFDELERQHVKDTINWINSGVNIYRIEKPDKPPKHLVSYFVLVDTDYNCLLLGDHINAQLWLPSGGHVEPGEDPKETVVREIQEELKKKAIFVRSNDKPLFLTQATTVGLTAGHIDVSLWYIVRGHKHDRINFDRREFSDMEWFSFQEILESDPSIFDPNMQRFTRKLKSYLKQ